MRRESGRYDGASSSRPERGPDGRGATGVRVWALASGTRNAVVVADGDGLGARGVALSVGDAMGPLVAGGVPEPDGDALWLGEGDRGGQV